MDLVMIHPFVFVLFFVTDYVYAEVCYEYKNSNTRAFECSDGCCGSNTDAYCCMSPILIVGIVVGSLAGLIIIGVIVFICYQKHKQRQFNKIQKIAIDQLDNNPTPRKLSKQEKKEKKLSKGGMVTATHGDDYNKQPLTGNDFGGGYNTNTNKNGVYYNNTEPIFESPDSAYPPPPPPVPRTGTWLLNNNNTGKQNSNKLPPPPPPVPAIALPKSNNNNYMGPIPQNTTSTAAVFNLPVPDTLPAHPGAAELYIDRTPIRPLPGSLPPLPPVQPKN